MSSPSKGPWIALRDNEYVENGEKKLYFETEECDRKRPYTKIQTLNGETVVCAHDCFEFRSENDANLVAAAPDMLEALHSVYCECSSLYPHAPNCFMVKVEKAIKKALG